MLEQEYNNRYEFENNRRHSRTRESANTVFQKFCRRLGFIGDVRGTAIEDDLLNFIVHVHLPIQWYEDKIRTELKWRNGYIAATLLLLLAIPVVVQLFDKTSSASVAAISGLFAFYRGLSAWLDKRRIIAQRATASAALKGKLYDFEQRWDQVELATDRIAEQFRKEIETVIADARAIVREETILYFEALSYPVFNLGTMLQTSASQANTLVRTLGHNALPGQRKNGGQANFDEIIPARKQTRPHKSFPDL